MSALTESNHSYLSHHFPNKTEFNPMFSLLRADNLVLVVFGDCKEFNRFGDFMGEGVFMGLNSVLFGKW